MPLHCVLLVRLHLHAATLLHPRQRKTLELQHERGPRFLRRAAQRRPPDRRLLPRSDENFDVKQLSLSRCTGLRPGLPSQPPLHSANSKGPERARTRAGRPVCLVQRGGNQVGVGRVSSAVTRPDRTGPPGGDSNVDCSYEEHDGRVPYGAPPAGSGEFSLHLLFERPQAEELLCHCVDTCWSRQTRPRDGRPSDGLALGSDGR